MSRIVIFGGTTEGRSIAEYCAEHGIHADVSVTTDYGVSLLPDSDYIHIMEGVKDEPGIKKMLSDAACSLVIDATHPYAVSITGTLQKVTASSGIRYVRVLRERAAVSGKTVESIDGLIAYLNRRLSEEKDLRILSTLGGKSLRRLTEVKGFRECVYARVLPSPEIWDAALSLGFPANHIIAGKGPFTTEQNIAHIRISGAGMLVTKESGKEGGYPEKAVAAELTGAELVTLVRPCEEGISLEKAVNIIGNEI